MPREEIHFLRVSPFGKEARGGASEHLLSMLRDEVGMLYVSSYCISFFRRMFALSYENNNCNHCRKNNLLLRKYSLNFPSPHALRTTTPIKSFYEVTFRCYRSTIEFLLPFNALFRSSHFP